MATKPATLVTYFNPATLITHTRLQDYADAELSMPPNIILCNYKDVLTGRVHVFDLTNLC
jgi:hypothetical protein